MDWAEGIEDEHLLFGEKQNGNPIVQESISPSGNEEGISLF